MDKQLTIKQQLIKAGVKENEIDSHASDLYVLKNSVSTQWLESYEHKQQVKTFVSQIDNNVWYDIPFGYMNEYIENKNK